MIKLRGLRETDAEKMLEWMLDSRTQRSFQRDMSGTTLEMARQFCRTKKDEPNDYEYKSLHYAITDETDEYLGTISLKNIDNNNKSAEYAIALREKARGKGIAVEATRLLLKKGFEDMGLHRIYLTVFADNVAAIKLYERSGFIYEGELREHINRNGEFVSWRIYGILRKEYEKTIES